MTASGPLRVLAEFHEGRTVSALLENGFTEACLRRGATVDLVTPAAEVPGFRERYGAVGVDLHGERLVRELARFETLELRVGAWLEARGRTATRRALWRAVGEPVAARRAVREQRLLETLRPDVVLTPHVAEGFGRGLVAAARRAGIPTVGNVMSWDNPYRPLQARPDRLGCWSERTRSELVARRAYPESRITAIGCLAFDPYFADDARWSREQLCGRLGLDPTRPVVVFASLGQFRPFMDETGTFAALLDALDRGLVHGRPQVVLRLHPVSRLAYFEPFLGRPDLVVSRFSGYVPGMMWTPRREEVILAGNLLRHADVCVSPGSTMTIETAIFDTPTVMPAFNPFTRKEYGAFFEEIWLRRHFRWIVEEDLVPVAHGLEELRGGGQPRSR